MSQSRAGKLTVSFKCSGGSGRVSYQSCSPASRSDSSLLAHGFMPSSLTRSVERPTRWHRLRELRSTLKTLSYSSSYKMAARDAHSQNRVLFCWSDLIKSTLFWHDKHPAGLMWWSRITHTGRARRSSGGWRDKRCRSDSRSGNTTAPETHTQTQRQTTSATLRRFCKTFQHVQVSTRWEWQSSLLLLCLRTTGV